MKELALLPLAKAVSLRRVLNGLRALVSYQFSRMTRKHYLWGYPLVLTVEPTNLCNLRCPQCYTGSGKLTRERGTMSLALFKRIIDEIGDCLFYILLYNQGEPYLNSLLFDFIRYAKQKGICVTTSTNGHFWDKSENIVQTIESGLDSIIVSLDGVDPETYAQYRIGGDLAKVTSGVKRLIQTRNAMNQTTPRVYLQFLVMKHNETQIMLVKQWARELQVDRLLLKTVQVEDPHDAELFLPREERYRRYRLSGNKLQLKNKFTSGCQRLWISSVVNWDGSVVPCCFDKNGIYTFGNLTENSTFSQIWKSEAYADFRLQTLRRRESIDLCRNCTQGQKTYL